MFNVWKKAAAGTKRTRLTTVHLISVCGATRMRRVPASQHFQPESLPNGPKQANEMGRRYSDRIITESTGYLHLPGNIAITTSIPISTPIITYEWLGCSKRPLCHPYVALLIHMTIELLRPQGSLAMPPTPRLQPGLPHSAPMQRSRVYVL
jgi:hypothetical protein